MSEPEAPIPLLMAARTRRAKAERWPQSVTTKRRVLDAAKILFLRQGYDATSINDIVRVSGVSVGSIYHQFGGKPEVFMALAQELFSQHAAASMKATKKARDAGETDPVELYIAGAKAYLLESWKNRDISRFLLGDDGPPGYADFRRKTEAGFLHGAQSLVIGKPPRPDSSAYVVIGLIQAAALQIVEVSDRQTAVKIAEYFTGLIRTLARGRPED